MKYSQKQSQTNVQRDYENHKNSHLFMLLGLALALLTVYVVIEIKTEVKEIAYLPKNDNLLTEEDPIPTIVIETPKTEVPKTLPTLKVEPVDIIIVDNNTHTDDNMVFKPVDDTPQKSLDDKLKGIVEQIVVEDDTFDFVGIEQVPIFPGCKGSNEDLRKCFSEQVNNFVAKNYNPDLAQQLGLDAGIKKIHVQFIVDKKGEISDVKVRAPHTSLAKEAERVVRLLPKMEPGKQNKDDVSVKFQLPITLKVEE